MRMFVPLRLRSAAVGALLALSLTTVVAGCSAGFSIGADDGDGSAGTATYTDSGFGYSFSYPADWVLEDDYSLEATGGAGASAGIAVIDPDGAVAGDYHIDLVEISVYELNMSVDDSMLADVRAEVEGVLEDVAGQDASWKTVEPLSDTTVAGIKGFRTTVGYDMHGVPTTAMLYFLFDGSLEYELMLQAATENWEDMQADFEAAVASFQP